MRGFTLIGALFCVLLAACGSRGTDCPTGRRACPGSTACVNLDSDIANCGACGHACSGTDVCLAGTCGPLHPTDGGTTDAGPHDGSVPVDATVPELCMPTCS